jgi:hypothetical protein
LRSKSEKRFLLFLCSFRAKLLPVIIHTLLPLSYSFVAGVEILEKKEISEKQN